MDKQHTQTTAHTQVSHAKGSSGMPQLDPSSFASQLFWLAACFIALYVIMSRGVVPRIRSVLDMRESQIAADLESAEKARVDAAKAKEIYEKELISAKAKASGLLLETQQAIEVAAVKSHHKLDLKLADELNAAEAQIAKQTQSAQVLVQPLVEELTTMIVEKVIRTKPADAKVKAAVSETMKG